MRNMILTCDQNKPFFYKKKNVLYTIYIPKFRVSSTLTEGIDIREWHFLGFVESPKMLISFLANQLLDFDISHTGSHVVWFCGVIFVLIICFHRFNPWELSQEP